MASLPIRDLALNHTEASMIKRGLFAIQTYIVLGMSSPQTGSVSETKELQG